MKGNGIFVLIPFVSGWIMIVISVLVIVILANTFQDNESDNALLSESGHAQEKITGTGCIIPVFSGNSEKRINTQLIPTLKMTIQKSGFVWQIDSLYVMMNFQKSGFCEPHLLR